MCIAYETMYTLSTTIVYFTACTRMCLTFMSPESLGSPIAMGWRPSSCVVRRPLKALYHCTGGCKKDTKRKKNLAVRRKTLCIRRVLIVYVFHTFYPLSIRTL